MSNNSEKVKSEPETKKSINDYLARYQRIPLSEKLFFAQHLRVMIKSGMALAQALRALFQQTKNKKFKKILNEIKNDVEKGTSFSEGLAKHRKVFGELFISMIRAGETAGKMEEVLDQLYIQMKKNHEIVSKVRGAMIYPSVVIVAMLIVGTLMIVFVIPKLTEVFVESNIELPLPTRILIGISDFVRDNGILTAVAAAVLIISFWKILKTKQGKYYFDFLLLKTPIIGKIVKKINLARFSRTLSSLLKTDIPIIKTLEITSDILGNSIYKKIVRAGGEKVSKGEKLVDAIKEFSDIFPPIVTEMVAVGEETGSLDNVLSELAHFYETEVDQTMGNLPSIIEPILILMLGFAVAGMALAVMMPMYSMTQVV